MELFELICPRCDAKLQVEKDGHVVCKHCGHHFYIDKGQPETHNHYYGNVYNSENVPPPPYTHHRQTSGTRILPAIVFVLVVLSFAGIMFLRFIGSGRSSPLQEPPPQTSYVFRQQPETAVAKAFLAYAFGKPANSVTSDEVGQIKYISISYADGIFAEEANGDFSGWEIAYSFDNYESTSENDISIDKFHFASGEPSDEEKGEIAKDLEIFTGLTWLDINDHFTARNLTLLPFKNLSAFKSTWYNIGSELAFADKAAIKHLAFRVYSTDEIAALLEFPALESAEILDIDDETDDFSAFAQLKNLAALNISGCADISWLSMLPNLKHLQLSCYEVADYKSLYTLSGLEALTITSASSMKSIDFVKNMPDLKSISLSGTSLLDLEPLRDNLSLTSLSFQSNENALDLSAVGSLRNLTQLKLDTGYEVVPDLSGLTFLADVAVKESLIGSIPENSLKSLTATVYSYEFSCEAFTRFQNLENLTIMSSGHDLFNPHTLAALPKLKTLNIISDFYCFIEMPQLFSLGNVENMHLENLHLHTASGNLENSSLKNLAFSGCDYFRESDISYHELGDADEALELLAHLNGLVTLSIPNAKLKSVEFVAAMPNLKTLNVNDNYVQDLSPVTQLTRFETLFCRNNPIQSFDILPSSITVVD